jgi:hypothetical protein
MRHIELDDLIGGTRMIWRLGYLAPHGRAAMQTSSTSAPLSDDDLLV